MSEMERPDVKGKPSVMWVDRVEECMGEDTVLYVGRRAKFSKEVLFAKSELRLFSLGHLL